MEGQLARQLSGSAGDSWRGGERRATPVALPTAASAVRLLSLQSHEPYPAAAVRDERTQSGVSPGLEGRRTSLPAASASTAAAPVAAGQAEGHDGDAHHADLGGRASPADVLRQGPGDDRLHGDGFRAQRFARAETNDAYAGPRECVRHELRDIRIAQLSGLRTILRLDGDSTGAADHSARLSLQRGEHVRSLRDIRLNSSATEGQLYTHFNA